MAHKNLGQLGFGDSWIERNQSLNNRLDKISRLVQWDLIEASVKKPDQQQNGKPGKSSVDPEAKWARKGKKLHFGFKGHIAVDEKSGLIRRTDFTSATVHDGHQLSRLITGEEDWVYADKGYASKANNELLRTGGIKNGIMRKGYRERQLTSLDKVRNRLIAKRRSAVERVFGTLKRYYLGGRARYRGIRKNHLSFNLLCICFNLRKMEKLCTG